MHDRCFMRSRLTGKRLRHIVSAPSRRPADLVFVLPARGEHQNRRANSPLAKCFQNSKSVEPRQAEIATGLPKLVGGTCHPYRREWDGTIAPSDQGGGSRGRLVGLRHEAQVRRPTGRRRSAGGDQRVDEAEESGSPEKLTYKLTHFARTQRARQHITCCRAPSCPS